MPQTAISFACKNEQQPEKNVFDFRKNNLQSPSARLRIENCNSRIFYDNNFTIEHKREINFNAIYLKLESALGKAAVFPV
jgi:hypothetical protein